MDNYETAFNHLKNTEKRLSKNESLGADYGETIRNYEQKKYIRKVTPDEAMVPEGRVWFLPHFPVCRPDRATTKTHIVFNASAKHRGVSLNEMILPRPKLLSNLFDVLMRFRRYPHRRTGRGGRGSSCPPPPPNITKSKSRANIQHKSGKKWEIKKPKSPPFVVQIKVVVQYSLKSWAILAINSSGKIFLTPKMVH